MVIFKLIQTKGGKYVYDRQANTLLHISDNEYTELKQIQKNNTDFENSNNVKKYRLYGLFQENSVQKIKHPATDYVKYYLDHRVSDMCLQVTQQCNLRCAYCAYSGNYYDRQHSEQRMSLNLAKQSIDFFLSHSRDNNRIHLAFYGGEPLLEFELIRQCVKYIKEKTEGKTITFGMTTNGTLLSDEVVDYLMSENFRLTISLDGSREEHDANRKFRNGKGTFDVIMSNVKRIHERYPDYSSKILFNTVINPKSDLGCVMNFFKSSDVFQDKNLIFSSVIPIGLKEEISYDERYENIRKYEILKMYLSMIRRINEEYVSPLVKQRISDYMTNFFNLQKHTTLDEECHHGGPCIPGKKKVFVTTNGTLYPCERVSETCDYFKIGTITNGFQVDKVQNLINNGKVSAALCKKCWALPFCTICSGQIEFKNSSELKLENKIEACRSERARIHAALYDTCVLKEFGYEADQNKWGVY